MGRGHKPCGAKSFHRRLEMFGILIRGMRACHLLGYNEHKQSLLVVC